MTDACFLEGLETDRAVLGVYADWLEEAGRTQEAHAWREIFTQGWAPCPTVAPSWDWYAPSWGGKVASADATATLPGSVFYRLAPSTARGGRYAHAAAGVPWADCPFREYASCLEAYQQLAAALRAEGAP